MKASSGKVLGRTDYSALSAARLDGRSFDTTQDKRFDVAQGRRVAITLAWLGIWWGLVVWLGVTILTDRTARGPVAAWMAADPQPIPPAPTPAPPGTPIPPAPTPPPRPEPIPPAP